jgi:hypothetical protein
VELFILTVNLPTTTHTSDVYYFCQKTSFLSIILVLNDVYGMYNFWIQQIFQHSFFLFLDYFMLNSIFLVLRVFAVTHSISLLLLWIWNEDLVLGLLSGTCQICTVGDTFQAWSFLWLAPVGNMAAFVR